MLYPPILASIQSVCLIDEINSGYEIKFSLASITSPNEVKHIGILFAQQSNNRSVANTDIYPDGIIYKSFSGKENQVQYSVIVSASDLKSIEPGSLYKIQLRFGKNALNMDDFSEWHKTQVEQNAFSEWSTAMIIKPITAPVLEIQSDNSIYQSTNHGSINLTASLTPTFFGGCQIDEANKEVEDSYKFSLYDGNTLIESIDWQHHITGEQDMVYFKTLLTNQYIYKLVYEIQTNNGYRSSIETTFIAIRSVLGNITNLSISAEEDYENACVLIKLENIVINPDTQQKDLITGNYVLTRSSEGSNFQQYEDIKFFNFFKENLSTPTTCYIDYTVESGITYKYALQSLNTRKIRSNPLYTSTIRLDLEYSYLVRDGVQLRLTFNQKLSNFKYTTLRTKQDTIGDKYPHLIQNGNAYYAEFPVTGLISYQGNTDMFFVSKASAGVYYKDELVVPYNKFETLGGKRQPELKPVPENLYPLPSSYQPSSYDGEVDYTITTDLTDNNLFIERKFREKVEEFLNDFNCKLYRSPTEGNIVVNLMNISLTPIESLGRMLYEFSATAYEILDCTLEELDSYGIISIGEYSTNVNVDRIYPSFGQIEYWPNSTTYKLENESIYNKISSIEETVVDIIYKYHLEDISSFWIENYPREIIVKKLQEEMVKVESLQDVNKIEYLEELLNTSESSGFGLKMKMGDNETNIYVSPNKVYNLNDESITDLDIINTTSDTTILGNTFKYPILINYKCNLSVQKNTSIQEVVAVEISTNFGQIAGIFTEDEELLEQYNYDYRESEDLLIATEGNYNVYKSLDIREIIRNTIKQYLENESKNEIILIPQQDGSWKDENNNEYRFNDLNSVSIEADIGTEIHIGESDQTYVTYQIGKVYPLEYIPGSSNYKNLLFESNKIIFPSTVSHSECLKFENTTFATIDFIYTVEKRIVSSIEEETDGE